MKHADKNEIDILLRGLAKKSRRATGVDNQFVGEHLDADELSSFAEDALPAASRARYTAHLADCSTCRKQVASLAVAAGVAARDAAAPVAETKTFWQRLSPIFSPAVLKYALPVLVFSVLIGASLLMVRRAENEFVAQRSTREQTAATTSPQNNQNIEQHYGQTADTTTVANQETTTRGNAEPAKESTGEQQAASAASPMSQTATTQAPQPTYAPEVAAADAPPPPPKPKEVSTKQAEEVDTAKTGDAVEERRIETERNKEAERQKKKDQSEVAKNESAPAAGAVAAQRVEKLPTVSRRAQISKDGVEGKRSRGRDDDETRSVAGRSFRREGNTWIDTAYSSSVRVVNVRRGSEQFRALVADEPGLKTISDALSGTVIAVWKGRAYKIQ